MADDKTTIAQLITRVAEFEQERDWEKYHSPKNLTMGIAIETGELLEHFLWLSEEESQQVVKNEEQMAQVREEVADVLTYLLMLAHTMGFDLSDAFYDKMEYNAQKYPADLYRGKFKLDD